MDLPISQDTTAAPQVPAVHTRKTKGLRVALLLNIPSMSTKLGHHVPISLLYLGAQLTRQGHTPSILDRRTFANDQDFLRALKNADPRLVGVSLYADCYAITYQLINRIRRYAPHLKIVLGGPEVSANRDGVAQIFDGKVDYLLCGEAEFTLGNLANAQSEGDEAVLEAIEGLSSKINGVWRHNAAPKPIKDVNSIPFPQRELISPENWRAHYYRIGLKRPSDVILTSRGCPFSCRFCYRLTTGYRARSPESVLAELGTIYARGIRGLSIIDDNFLSNRKRCIAILEGILAKNWRLAIKCRGTCRQRRSGVAQVDEASRRSGCDLWPGIGLAEGARRDGQAGQRRAESAGDPHDACRPACSATLTCSLAIPAKRAKRSAKQPISLSRPGRPVSTWASSSHCMERRFTRKLGARAPCGVTGACSKTIPG